MHFRINYQIINSVYDVGITTCERKIMHICIYTSSVELQRSFINRFAVQLSNSIISKMITTSERDDMCFVHQTQLKIHILHKIIFSYPRFRSCIIIVKFIKYMDAKYFFFVLTCDVCGNKIQNEHVNSELFLSN